MEDKKGLATEGTTRETSAAQNGQRPNLRTARKPKN